MKRLFEPLLAVFLLLLTLSIWGGMLAFILWPTKKYEFSVGAFEGFPIGQTKEFILANWPNEAVVVSSVSSKSIDGSWVNVTEITPEQKTSLLIDDEWWITDSGQSVCEPKSCPGVQLIFSKKTLSHVRVACHFCP